MLRCALLAEGRALLLLVPSEQEAMLKALAGTKVPVKAIKMNPNKQQPITGALQALLSKDSTLKVSTRSLPFSVTQQVFLLLPIQILTVSNVQRTFILCPRIF